MLITRQLVINRGWCRGSVVGSGWEDINQQVDSQRSSRLAIRSLVINRGWYRGSVVRSGWCGLRLPESDAIRINPDLLALTNVRIDSEIVSRTWFWKCWPSFCVYEFNKASYWRLTLNYCIRPSVLWTSLPSGWWYFDIFPCSPSLPRENIIIRGVPNSISPRAAYSNIYTR